MFVKIVHNITRKTQVIEASEVIVAREDHGDQVIIDMVSGGVQKALTYKQGTHTVYLMNDQGKTLDTYRL